jgi:hypothetical protein
MQRCLGAIVVAVCVAFALVSCGGGSSGSSGTTTTPTSPTNGSVTLTVTDLQGSAEPTPTGATYHISFTVRASGTLGATVTAITINLASATRTGSAVLDNISDRIAAGGSFVERVDVTSTNGTDLYTQVTNVRLIYTDGAGVAGSMTSGPGSITQPTTPTPTPTPTCTVTFSPSALTLGATGSAAKTTVQLTTTSGCAWSATSGDTWLNASPKTGTGSAVVTVEATDNAASASRTSRITVAGSVLSVTQNGQASSPSPTPTPSPSPGPNGPTCTSASIPANAVCIGNGTPPVTAVCADGAYSCSNSRQGTCSSHGGVKCWVCPGLLCNGLIGTESAFSPAYGGYSPVLLSGGR